MIILRLKKKAFQAGLSSWLSSWQSWLFELALGERGGREGEKSMIMSRRLKRAAIFRHPHGQLSRVAVLN